MASIGVCEERSQGLLLGRVFRGGFRYFTTRPVGQPSRLIVTWSGDASFTNASEGAPSDIGRTRQLKAIFNGQAGKEAISRIASFFVGPGRGEECANRDG